MCRHRRSTLTRSKSRSIYQTRIACPQVSNLCAGQADPDPLQERDYETKGAIKLAIECLRKEYQALAVHANLCTMYSSDYPAALAAVKSRQAIREAIEILQTGFQPSLFK